MEPSQTRRAFLAAGGTASIIALAGCTDILRSKELAHEVEVFNREDTAHSISVTVTNDSGDVLYQREFHLEGEHAEEETEPFTGIPTTISVTVDDDRPTEHSWPDANCEERGVKSAGGVGLYLTSDGGIRIETTCNTVYAE